MHLTALYAAAKSLAFGKIPKPIDRRRSSTERNPYLFHPREFAFCGFSGSGKTFLISRLIRELSPTYSIGYVKHDAHGFDIDIPGKDTFEARKQGARMVAINDSQHWALVASGTPSMETLRQLYASMDIVFVEGYKNSTLPKIVLIDKNDSILTAARAGDISRISAFAGTAGSRADLKAHYFNRDDIEAIQKHILSTLGFAGK